MRKRHGISLRKACKWLDIYLSVYYYQPKERDDKVYREKLSEWSTFYNKWGYKKLYDRFREEGYKVNHKRIYRIYTEMGLNLRRKSRKRLSLRPKEGLLQPLYPNLTWSMDFMHDTLSNGIRFRSFNVIDDFNREALNLTIDTSLPSKRIIRELDKLIAWRGAPEAIRMDNGPEFIAHDMELWAEDRGIDLKFIQKGKPNQNGYVERFNRTFREEVLGAFSFRSLKEVKTLSEAWIEVYNNKRPHEATKNKPPVKFMQERLRGYAPPSFLHDPDNSWESLVLNVTN